MKKMVLDEKLLMNGSVLASLPCSVLQATEIWVGLEMRPAPYKVGLGLATGNYKLYVSYVCFITARDHFHQFKS